jgi:hypothetical protein
VTEILEVFEGVGNTLEQALAKAHSHIRPRPGRDFAISRVIDWGMQRGGFTDAVVFYVKVVEDKHAPFKT